MAKIPEFTKEQYNEFARSIEDGSYFSNARKWYSIVYMSIMPERCFYIILMTMAVFAALMALISLLQLMPIAPTQPLLLPMKDVFRDMPIVKPLRVSPRQPVNDALQRYFLAEYVTKRERYSFEEIQANFRFLRNYSNANVMEQYRKLIDPTSPRSPINRYERKAKRTVDIKNISIKRVDGKEEDWETDGKYLAVVDFKARINTEGRLDISRWQAQIAFDYVQLKMIQPDDLKNGKLKITPMKFTVTDYTVIEQSS